AGLAPRRNLSFRAGAADAARGAAKAKSGGLKCKRPGLDARAPRNQISPARLVRPATVAFRSDMEAGRAETVRAGHRMASAMRAAPETRAAAFGNPDRQIGRSTDRRGQDGRIGRRRKAESQRRTECNSTYHRSLPLCLRLD